MCKVYCRLIFNKIIAHWKFDVSQDNIAIVTSGYPVCAAYFAAFLLASIASLALVKLLTSIIPFLFLYSICKTTIQSGSSTFSYLS